MARFWPFGRKKDKQEAAEPPAAPPRREAPAPEPKPRGGVFGKLFGRGKGRKKPPEAPAAPEAPPAAPPTPVAPPSTVPQPPAKPAAAGGGEGAAGGEGREGEERQYPSSIDVTAYGTWQISSTSWEGAMHGSISGRKAKEFIDAYEAGDWQTCAQMVADHWDTNVADQLLIDRSDIQHVGWS